MTKKSLDYKFAKKFIIESRIKNISDQEIYNELVQRYFDKKGIAGLIKSVVKTEVKQKYKIYNHILIGLLWISIILKILTIIPLTQQSGILYTIILMLFAPSINLFFIYNIAKYNGPYYRFCGILSIASFFQSITYFENVSTIVINALLVGVVAGLCFYLSKKFYPTNNPKNFKTDSNGEYQFD